MPNKYLWPASKVSFSGVLAAVAFPSPKMLRKGPSGGGKCTRGLPERMGLYVALVQP
jgi:hypothetical protein